LATVTLYRIILSVKEHIVIYTSAGQHLYNRVDLIKWVSNVCTYVRLFIHKKFLLLKFGM